MNRQPNEVDAKIWEQLSDSYRAYSLAMAKFWANDVDRVTLIKYALEHGDNIATAFHIAQFLSVPELQDLFGEWVEWAMQSHGYQEATHALIQKLPRDWVRANIATYAEPLLREGTYDEYRRLLELYAYLGEIDLERRLALRALQSSDTDIKEAGQDTLAKLDGKAEAK
jgi:hypothetical protein